MARKRVADVVAEDQAQYEEAQRRAAVAVEDEPEPEVDETEQAERETEAAPDETSDPVPETISPLPNDDIPDIHTEAAHRTVRRDFTREERDTWEHQIVRATLKIRELRGKKKEAAADYNDRIQTQQDQAITAAERLKEGGDMRSVRVECRWDFATRTYYEIAEDTREVILKRPMELEEIERFVQRNLFPDRPTGSWLNAEQAVAAATDPTASLVSQPDDDDEDSDLSDDDGTGGFDEADEDA